jgi:hypothetical protein
MLVPSPPRVHIDGEPAFSQTSRTSLAKVLVLRQQPAPDGAATLGHGDMTRPPPAAGELEVIEEQRSRRGDVTALIGSPAAPHSLRLISLGIASSMLLLGFFAVIHLDLVQRMLEWLNGA